VQAVEMRDIIIPANLQDAMSREAQATRERRARIILGEAEVEIATLFEEASRCSSKRRKSGRHREQHAMRREHRKIPGPAGVSRSGRPWDLLCSCD
jgi:regulator of protease activity HflC (stomatin/prohibitin superfamily)